MNDMEILILADRCGVTAVSKHEWDGEKFNHTDDVLDGDFAGLIQFARLLIADEREACADICDGISEWYETRTDLNQTQKQVGQLAAEVCGVRIRERGEK